MIASMAWGFLVGFVAWESCFRLVKPGADWILDGVERMGIRAIAQIIVLMFFVSAVVALISLPTALSAAASYVADRPAPHPWKSSIGAAYVASLAGYFFLALLKRRGRRRADRMP